MPETQEQREARWAAERARQEAYRNSPEAQAFRAERIASGLCVIDDRERNGLTVSWCVTHDQPDTLAHHFSANPDAYND